MNAALGIKLGVLCALLTAIASGCGKSDTGADKGAAGAAGTATPGGSTDSPGDWTTFEPEQGKFSLRAPGTMMEVHTVTAGKKFSLKTPTLTYTVSYNDTRLPADAAAEQVNKLLDAEVSALPIEEDCKILGQSKTMEVAGEPGCEVEVEMKDKSHRRIRMVVSQSRLFRLEVAGTSEAVVSADAEMFLHSFKLSR
jgi:hypothetical protein